MNNDQNPLYDSHAVDTGTKPPIGSDEPLVDDNSFPDRSQFEPTAKHKVEKIADKAARKATDTEKKFDQEQHEPFTH